MKMKLEKGLTPGKYTATITRFEEIESKFGPALKLIYETADGQEASELVNCKYSPKTKLGKRVEEILGSTPEEIDLTMLLGKTVEITLVEKEDSDFCKISKVKLLELDEADVPF